MAPSSPSSILLMDPISSSSPSESRRGEEEDPMLLSPVKKKRKTTDTRAHQQDPQLSTSSPRTTRLSASQQTGPSRTRSGAAATSSSPLKRSSPVKKNKVDVPAPRPSSTTRTTRNSSSPTKKPTPHPTPASTTPSKRAKKEDPVAPPSSSRRRGGGGARPSSSSHRISRSPSPSSSTSPRKPSGWVGWELATAPMEELPFKGFDSGLEILKKQGLLDPQAQFKLRNGRTVVGRLDEKRKSGVGRWGDVEDDDEEEEEPGTEAGGEEQDVEAELGIEKEKEDDDELDVEKPPDEMDWQPLLQQQTSTSSASLQLRQQHTLEPHLLAHLPKTKALVLAHLTGRIPPLPPTAPPPPPPPLKPDPKGKGKAKAVAPTPSALEVPAEENEEGVKTLVELLRGTVERGEGNSCLIQGVRGGGKTTVLNKALETITSSSPSSSGAPPPIVIRLSALIQTDDRAAIREIGRQVGAEGFDKEDGAAEEAAAEGEGEGGEPKEVLQITTLPSHLLAILTAPSKKAIVIVLEEFDLFAGFGRGGRQMLLYCLLDVVQSIRPTLSTTTLSSRGVAVVGLTSRVDTLHLLEKRVKSRFSHRIIRISSPMHGDRSGTVANLRHPVPGEEAEEEEEEEEKEEVPKWMGVVGRALVPWENDDEEGRGEWRELWRSSVGKVLEDEEVKKGMKRLSWMSSDVRAVLKIFIRPMIELSPVQPLLTPSRIIASIAEQAEGPGWGKDMRKLAGLSPPSLAVLASIKDLGERGIIEFNFEHIFFTYGEFAKAKLVGSGKPRFSRGMMREAFNNLISTSLIFPSASTTNAAFSTMSTSGMDFVKHRCAVPAFDVVEFFRGEGGRGVMTQLSGWGKKWDV